MRMPEVAGVSIATNKRLDMEDLANRSRPHNLLNRKEVGIPTTILIDRKRQAALLGEPNEFVGLIGGQAEWLLDHGMLARKQQLARQRGVCVGWCAHDGRLDRWVTNDLLHV